MILTYWRQIVGQAVNYFTQGSSYSIQWNYGDLLEYSFVSIAVIITICLVFKFVFSLIKLFFK